MEYKEFVELLDSGNVNELTVEKIKLFFATSCENGHLVVAKSN